MTITVEWVEVTGRTLEEATERALEQLGVEETDAEVEVLEEPRSGLFGRTRGQARVRARVRPKGPRPKQERRRRAPRSGESKGNGRNGQDGRDRASATPAPTEPAGEPAAEQQASRPRSSGGGKATNDRQRPAKEREMMDEQAQQETVTGFLSGLVEAMGVTATASAEVDEDGIVRATVDGEGVGALVGPGLATLEAIQEISRNVLQREAGDREHGKVVLDVAGVRELRREALAEFVATAAERARSEDVDVVLEVMSSVDRKTVHDTVATLDGVVSVSEGEDPRRRVVIRPA